MIDFAKVKAALQAEMGVVATLAVAYENDGFDPDTTTETAYLRFTVAEGKSQAPVNYIVNETAAPRLMGSIMVMGCVKAGQGDAPIESALSAVKTAFQGKTFALTDGTRIRVQAAAGGAQGREGGWWQKLIVLPFIADQQSV